MKIFYRAQSDYIVRLLENEIKENQLVPDGHCVSDSYKKMIEADFLVQKSTIESIKGGVSLKSIQLVCIKRVISNMFYRSMVLLQYDSSSYNEASQLVYAEIGFAKVIESICDNKLEEK